MVLELLQNESNIGNRGGLLVHEGVSTLLLHHDLAHSSHVFLVPLLLVPQVYRPLRIEIFFCHGDHFLGRGELAQQRELPQVVINVQSDLRLVEVQGEVWHPHILADCSGNGLLTMVDTLLEEVAFLEVGRVRQIAMTGWRDTAG